jgi:hypothetical protein
MQIICLYDPIDGLHFYCAAGESSSLFKGWSIEKLSSRSTCTKMTLVFWGISFYQGLGTGVRHQEAAYPIFSGMSLSAADDTSVTPLQQALSLSLFLLHRQLVGHVYERGAKPCARATAQLNSSHAVPFQYRFCDMHSW